MSEIKGVLFDLDGTLIDTYDLILSSMRYTMDHYIGDDFTDEFLMKGVGTPLWNQMLDFAGGPGNEEQADEMTAYYRAYNDAAHDEHAKSFPGILEMVDRLHEAGMRTAVVTGKRHTLAVHGLELFGMGDKMEFVLGSDDCAQHKPQPGPVLDGCAKLGLDPSECVYVGDSPYDIASGNAAGCTTVAVTWGMFPVEQLKEQQPDRIIGFPGELLDVLK